MKNPSRAPLFGAILVYVILTGSLIFRVGWGAAPDETAHALYMESIATTGKLPVFTGQVPDEPGYEFHQPPLYYLLGAILWALLPAGIENYATRFLSLFFCVLTIGMVWKSAKLRWGDDSKIPAYAVFFVALWPLHQGLGACVNNDSLAGFLAASLFFWIAKFWIDGPTQTRVLWLGATIGAAGLTKLTVLPLGILALVALGFAAPKHGSNAAKMVAIAGGLALFLMAPMLVRNQILGGDPFNYILFSRAATSGTPGFPQFSTGLITGYPVSFGGYARAMLWQIWMTTWGFFGGPNSVIAATQTLHPDGPRVPDLRLIFPMLILILAPLLAIWGRFKTPFLLDEARRATRKWWFVGVVLVVLAWTNFAYNHFSGGQARYLHPAILPVAIGLCAGWVGILGENRALKIASTVVGATLLCLSLLNIFLWKTLV